MLKRRVDVAGIAMPVCQVLDSTIIGHGVQHRAQEKMESKLKINLRQIWKCAAKRRQERATGKIEFS